MNLGFYSGVTGLGAFQTAMNITGNNIANSNTTGYKPEKTTFRDLIYTEMYVNTETDPIVGTGVKAMSGGFDFSGSGLQLTEGVYDFALTGDGFFALEQNGEMVFTRDGAFQAGSVGDDYYLVASDGSFVLDSEGNRIQLEREENGINLITDGLVDRIGIYQVDNPEYMTAISGNRFTETDASGILWVVNADGEGSRQIRAGALERSGVSLSDEMTNMILAQRGFQMSSRVIQTADEIEDTVNNLRR